MEEFEFINLTQETKRVRLDLGVNKDTRTKVYRWITVAPKDKISLPLKVGERYGLSLNKNVEVKIEKEKKEKNELSELQKLNQKLRILNLSRDEIKEVKKHGLTEEKICEVLLSENHKFSAELKEKLEGVFLVQEKVEEE